MSWIKSIPCLSGAHCEACRGSAEFRQTIVDAGLETERDFACPWGGTPGFRMVFKKKGCTTCLPIIVITEK